MALKVEEQLDRWAVTPQTLQSVMALVNQTNLLQMQQLPNESKIKAMIFFSPAFSSNTSAEISEGKDPSGGLRSFTYRLLSSCFLHLHGRPDKRLEARANMEFLWIYCRWRNVNFSYEFFSAVGLSHVRLKDKENLISGTKLSYLNLKLTLLDSNKKSLKWKLKIQVSKLHVWWYNRQLITCSGLLDGILIHNRLQFFFSLSEKACSWPEMFKGTFRASRGTVHERT